MRKSHCLFHPSKFESFGHVIFESLLNGSPVIISKNTPWQHLKGKKVGFDLSLDEEEKFICISYFNSCIDKVYIKYRKSSLNYANKIMLKNRLFFKKRFFNMKNRNLKLFFLILYSLIFVFFLVYLF